MQRYRGGVESNRTNFELIFIEFFELFFTFRINRIINFRIESNEFRTNPASEKFDSIYSWSRIESNEFRINFHRIFRIFFALSNQSNRKFSNRIERISNEFQFDSTPTKVSITVYYIGV